MTIKLEVKRREGTSKASTLRSQGIFPAILYGKKEKSTPISINHGEFMKVWKKAGESSVITIDIEGKPTDALIHEVQFDPVSGNPIHADFYAFEKGHKLEVSIPLEFIGTSPAVKDLGGVLVKVLHELKIKADPSNLPHAIEIDISPLAVLDSHITAGDIKLPSGIELAENPEEVVVNVSTPKEEKEEESAPIDLSAIEVEKKGKKEEEGEAPAEATEEAK